MLKTGFTLRFVAPPVCRRQDPNPTSVEPARGPAAGGTVITIKGKDLDTASQEDVTVSVGGVPCEVYASSSSYTSSCSCCSSSSSFPSSMLSSLPPSPHLLLTPVFLLLQLVVWC